MNALKDYILMHLPADLNLPFPLEYVRDRDVVDQDADLLQTCYAFQPTAGRVSQISP